MRKSIILAAFALAALVSCSKELAPAVSVEPAGVPEGYVPVTLTATVDVDTKSTLNGNFIMWAVGDSVAVFANGAGDPIKFTVSEIMTHDTMEGVKFSGNVPEGTESFLCLYPYQADATCSDGKIYLRIPNEQVIPADGDIDPKAMPSVANYPSAEAVSQFFNVMSLLKFNVGKTENVSEVRFRLLGDVNAAGDIVATPNEASAPLYVNSCSEDLIVKGKFAPEKDYYAVVGPVNAAGIAVQSVVGSKGGIRTSQNTLELVRNNGLNLGDVTEGVTWKYIYIQNAEDLVGFLAEASTYAAEDVVEFTDDVDMNGVVLTAVKKNDEDVNNGAAVSFAGTLDGCGHSINNFTSNGVALIGSLKGRLLNLTMESSCTITPCVGYYGPFVSTAENGSLVYDCINKADIAFADDGVAQYRVGGIVGVSQKDAVISGCENYGNFDVEYTTGATKMSTQYIGGIVASLNGASEVIRVAGCANYADHINVTVTNGAGGNMFSNVYIGGVAASTGINKGSKTVTAGYTLNYGELSSCENQADITATWTGGTGGYFKIGGIVGYGECALSYCENSGDIYVANTMTTGNASAPSVGGIAGVLVGTAAVSAHDCTNNGSVTVEGSFTNTSDVYSLGVGGISNTCIGGCVGLVGDNTTLVNDLVNNGVVTTNTTTTATAGSSHNAGGVIGYSMAEVKSCTNNANTDLTSKAKTGNYAGVVAYACKPVSECANYGTLKMSHNCDQLTKDQAAAIGNAGGIVGYGKSGCDITNCENTGAVLLTNTNGQTRLGGIAGMEYGVVDNCNNSGEVTLERVVFEQFVCANHVGGVIGYHNLAEAAVKNCSNSATVKSTLDPYANTSNLAGLVGNMQTKAIIENCSNSGDVIMDAAGSTNIVRVAGIAGVTAVKEAVLTGLTNTGNVTLTNFAGTAKNNYAAGILGIYQDGGNALTDCENHGNITVSGTGVIRLGGISGGLYGTFTNCSTEGAISVSGVAAGSYFGGMAGYSSASVIGGSVKSTISVSDLQGECYAGLLFAVVYRENEIKNFTLDGSFAGENAKAGILFGGINKPESPSETKYTLGAEEEPLTIKASANINGTAVVAAPATDEDLIADLSGKAEAQNDPILTYVNVVVE